MIANARHPNNNDQPSNNARRNHAPVSKTTDRRSWQYWKFRLNGLLLVLPFWFLYQALTPVFPPALPAATLGPYTVTVSPLNNDGPYAHHGEWVKDYHLQWCDGCVAKLRQGFLLVSASEPDLAQLSAGHSSLLHGHAHGLHVHAASPAQPGPNDKLWLVIEDWQGQVYRHSWAL